jgi:hypothetical protein
MRNTNLYRILLAVIVILVASLACNALNATPATPGASNFYMATDEAGTNKTNVFSTTDDFYVFFDVNAIEPGTNFQARWYALDVEGQDANEPFQTIDYAYEEGIANIYFQLTNSDGWPVGNYKVEIYMNGAKVGEQTFSVQ